MSQSKLKTIRCGIGDLIGSFGFISSGLLADAGTVDSGNFSTTGSNGGGVHTSTNGGGAWLASVSLSGTRHTCSKLLLQNRR